MSNEIKYSCKEESMMKPLNLDLFPHLANTDLFKIIKYLPKCSDGGPWIAGGSVWRAIANEPLKDCDIDVFFSSKNQFESASRQMNGYPLVRNVIQETKNKWNTTYKLHVNEGNFNKTIDIQFIKMNYCNSLERLLDNFDLTVCQFGWDGKNIISNTSSIEDLKKKQIKIWRFTYPKSLLRHLSKYLKNGFSIASSDTQHLIHNILSADIWKKSANGKYDEDENVKEVVVDNRWTTGRETARRQNLWVTTATQIVEEDDFATAPIHTWGNGDGIYPAEPTPVNPFTHTYANTQQIAQVPQEAAGGFTGTGYTTNTVPPITNIRPAAQPIDEDEWTTHLYTTQTRLTDLPIGNNNIQEEILTVPRPPTNFNEEVNQDVERRLEELNRPTATEIEVNRNEIDRLRGHRYGEIITPRNTAYHQGPRAPRGPQRFDEDRQNPDFRQAFNLNNGQENAQQERR